MIYDLFFFPCSKPVFLTNITGNATNITGNTTENMTGDVMDLLNNSSTSVDTNCFGQVTHTQAYYIFLVRNLLCTG